MIRKKTKLLLLIMLLTLFNSCELNNEPGKAEYESSVIFNLVANSSQQKLYVYRTADVGEEADRPYDDSTGHHDDGYGKFFIQNAEVQLANTDSVYNDFIIEEDNDFFHYSKGYRYSNNGDLTIFPDTKYLLEISYNDEIIFGETTTPGDFIIIDPKNNVAIKETNNANNDNNAENVSFNIKWSKSNNAKGYLIRVFDRPLVYSYHNRSYITADTTYNFQSFLGRGDYTLEILAYDENFHQYTNEQFNYSGLENAYGYFGSSVLKSIDFSVVY